MKCFRTIVALVLALTAQAAAQYSSSVFELTKATDLYDERGYLSSKVIHADGKLNIAAINGNVTYSYPILDQQYSGASIRMALNYCSSVAFSSYVNYDQGNITEPYSEWNRFTQNRPAWILGVNDFAVQVIGFAGHYHADPAKHVALTGGPRTAFSDSDFVWTIDGYDVCNRMSRLTTVANTTIGHFDDAIHLLRADGGLLTLRHRYDNPSNNEYMPGAYTGIYAAVETNPHGFAVVEFDSLYYPPRLQALSHTEAHIPRRLRYYPGDGLEYLFREWVTPYGFATYQDSTSHWGGMYASPSIFYLEEIRNSSGRLMEFRRARHGLAPTDNQNLTWYWPGWLDSTRGRANLVSADGVQLTYGKRGMTVEALGRTHTVLFSPGFVSGNAIGNEIVPLWSNGGFSSWSLTAATLPDGHPQNYKSFVGYVTDIIDPENRRTTFQYEPYVRKYEDLGFPRPWTSFTLRNWRLNAVTEPTQRYELCYYNRFGSGGQTCNSDTGALPSITPWNRDDLQMHNYVREVRKYDRLGNRLTTESYAFDTSTAGATTVVLTDHRDSTTRETKYSVEKKVWSALFDDAPPAVFTSVGEVREIAAGDTTTTYTIFDTVGTSLLVLPARQEVHRNGKRMRGDSIWYAAEIVRDLDGDSTMDALFGQELRFRYSTSFAGTTVLTRDTVEYLNLAHVARTEVFTERAWKKFPSIRNYFYYRDTVRHPDVVGRLWEDIYLSPPVAVFDSVTSTRAYVDPPIHGLTRRAWTSDAAGRYLAGTEKRYIDTVPLPYGRTYRGTLLVDSVVGRGRTAGHRVAGYRYGQSSDFFPNNFLIGHTAANGATKTYEYDLIRTFHGGPGVADSIGSLAVYGEEVRNSDRRDTLRLESNAGKSRWNSVPAVEQMHVRRYRPGGGLDSLRLGTYRRVGHFGQPEQEVDANGSTTRSELDLLGRLRHLWLPFDFRPRYAEVDTLSYEGWYSMVSPALSRYVRQKRSMACWVDTSFHYRVIEGDVDTTYLHGLLRAGRPSTVTPTCYCAHLMSAEKRGPSLLEDCNDTTEFAYHPAGSGYTGMIVQRVDTTNPLDVVGAATRIDSAALRLFVASMTEQCQVVTVSIPQFQFSRSFVFDCEGDYPELATRAREKEVVTGLMSDTIENSTGFFLRVDLTAVRDSLLHLKHGDYLTFAITSSTIGGTIDFVGGGQGGDKLPTVEIKGAFHRLPDTNDYTLAYRYDDANRSAEASGKVDDLRHTTSWYQIGPTQADLRRTRTMHEITADTKVTTSATTIGNILAPTRTDTVALRYNGRGQTISRRDQNGHTTQMRNDGRGRLTEVVHPGGASTTVAYAEGNRVGLSGVAGLDFFGYVARAVTTDESGRQTARYFDALERLRVEVADAGSGGLGLSTTYEYDELGRLTHVRDPAQKTTRYWYDALGRVQYKYHPDFDTISYAYDAVGNVRFTQSQEQANGDLMTFTEYDDLNRVTVIGEATITGGGGWEGWANTGDRNPGSEKGGGVLLGAATDTLSLNRWTDRVDPRRLNDGNQSAILTASKTLWMTPQQVVPSTFGHTAVGTEIDPCEFQTPSGLLGETEPPLPPFLKHPIGYHDPKPSPASLPTEFENLAKYPNFVRIVVNYDSLPPRVGPVWSNLPAYELWDSIAPKKKIRNMLGREVAVAYREHGGHPFHYVVLSYDERGRVEALLRYTENLGFDAVYYEYNSMNQVIAVRTADPLNQHATWYGYDHNGRVDTVWTKLQLGGGLSATAPRHPAADTLPRFSPDIAYTYTPRGQVDLMQYPPVGGWINYDYNARGWLDSIDAWALDTGNVTSRLFRQVLSYDPTGQITKQVWQHRGGSLEEQRYTYDSVSRLIAWATDLDSTTYLYDPVGNRMASDRIPIGFGSGYADTYKYPPLLHPDRLEERRRIDQTHHRWTSYTYDADGAVTGRSKRDSMIAPPNTVTTYPAETFSYSFRELLWRYTYNGATHDWRYRYSAAGEREQKRLYPVDTSSLAGADDNPWVYYLLGGGKEQLAVWHGRENYVSQCPTMEVGKVYLYPFEYNTFGGSNSRISTRLDGTGDGKKTFRIADHLGSNRVYIEENLTTNIVDYEPFGKAITGFGSNVPRQSFIDKEKDFENGLGDFGVRKYEEETGRFLSVDPFHSIYPSLQPYHYTGNSPLVARDPDGKVIRPVEGHVDRAERTAYERALAVNEAWAEHSPTIKKVVDRAKSEETTIDLYMFSEVGANGSGTYSRLHEDNKSLQTYWDDGGYTQNGKTLQPVASDGRTADVILYNKRMAEPDDMVPAQTLLDELMHAVTPGTNGGREHYDLYKGIVNEIDSGIFSPGPAAEQLFRDKLRGFQADMDNGLIP